MLTRHYPSTRCWPGFASGSTRPLHRALLYAGPLLCRRPDRGQASVVPGDAGPSERPERRAPSIRHERAQDRDSRHRRQARPLGHAAACSGREPGRRHRMGRGPVRRGDHRPVVRPMDAADRPAARTARHARRRVGHLDRGGSRGGGGGAAGAAGRGGCGMCGRGVRGVGEAVAGCGGGVGWRGLVVPRRWMSTADGVAARLRVWG